MRSKGTVILAAMSALAVLLACEVALAVGSLDFLENRSFDLRVRWAPPRQPPPPEIVIIDIDNPSFAALRDAIGRWPWTRLLWAELVRYLDEAGARLIVFDAIFSGRESDEVDPEFAARIAAADNVVLATAFVQYEADHVGGEGAAQSALPGALAVEDQAGLPSLSPQRYSPDFPLGPLSEAARALGAITAVHDPDGTVRRVALLYRWDQRYYPSLALATVAQARGLNAEGTIQVAETEFRWGSLQVPLTREGLLVPHWRPDAAAFPRLPLWKVTCSVFPEICASEQHFEPQDFRDKIVLIGASALGASDVVATPVDPVTPGFLVHAAALDSLLRGRAIAQSPPYLVHLLMFFFTALALVIVWGLGSTARSTLAVVALAALYTWGTVWGFGRWELWLPLTAPLATLLAGFVGQSLTRYVTTGRQLQQTRRTLSRYMSPSVVDHIMAHGGPDQLRGQRRVITVMFSDVRNFTKMSEQRPPVEVMDILNRYLDAMTEIVFEHNGVVDKFIGDGMLCYWGAFGEADRHARLAVSAAAKMLAKLEELNKNWQAQGLPELSIGVGINSGEAVFGNLGAGRKIEFTVLGDTVNVASRLESMNKEFKTNVILSETTEQGLGGQPSVQLLGEVAIRGREQKMKIYTLL